MAVALLANLFLAVWAWDYKVNGNDWVDPDCQDGTKQTPIDIEFASVIEIPSSETSYFKLHFEFEEHEVSVTTGYGVYRFIENFGKLLVMQGSTESMTSEIVNAHFHSPSENHLNGKEYDLEMHIVMEDESEVYSHVVYGVFFQVQGEIENEFLKDVIKAKDSKINFSLEKAFDSLEILEYYQFMGSLTTPPCTENAFWILDPNIRSMTQDQLDFFTEMWAGNSSFALGKGNNRELQGLGSRKVNYYLSFAINLVFAPILIVLAFI
ncbi:hypothetical protein SteCoe_23180 [Stentor coeruleus]|nr:hypothetical protein SteCoe_23180 [Stentor coeruleus]